MKHILLCLLVWSSVARGGAQAYPQPSCAEKIPEGLDLILQPAIDADRNVLKAYESWQAGGHPEEFDYEAPLNPKEYAVKSRVFEDTLALAKCLLDEGALAQNQTFQAYLAEHGFETLGERMLALSAGISDNSLNDTQVYLAFMTIQGLLMYTGTSAYHEVDTQERNKVLAVYEKVAAMVAERLGIYC